MVKDSYFTLIFSQVLLPIVPLQLLYIMLAVRLHYRYRQLGYDRWNLSAPLLRHLKHIDLKVRRYHQMRMIVLLLFLFVLLGVLLRMPLLLHAKESATLNTLKEGLS